MPRSIAAPTSRSASWAVGATPNVAVPRQIRDTFTPVEPRTAYFIINFLVVCGAEEGSAAVGPGGGPGAAAGPVLWSGVVGEGAGQLPEGVRLRLQRLGFLLGDVQDRGEGDEPARRLVQAGEGEQGLGELGRV